MNNILGGTIFKILKHRGNVKISDLAKEMHISSRQLERVVKDNVGISPKQITSLIKYQYLWNDMIFSRRFNILDAVDKYGYTDQAHLLHHFKQCHTILPDQAVQYALKREY